MAKKSIFWFRRDLRLEDNSGLFHALSESDEVVAVFVFDKNILSRLEDKEDKRVVFIHETLKRLNDVLLKKGSSFLIRYGDPVQIIPELVKQENADAVFFNRDYEPYALEREKKVESELQKRKVSFLGFKDQVIFEPNEVLKDDGLPYTVFTPFSRKWKIKRQQKKIPNFPSEDYLNKFSKRNGEDIMALQEIGFKEIKFDFPSKDLLEETLLHYSNLRDFPSKDATSRLSVHLRFGTVSIRKLVLLSENLSEAWLNELIWREFYKVILYHFPHVLYSSFKPNYDRIPWLNNMEYFTLWCEGKTGIPIVDAGMRELNETGFMHNRVRMIVASFLTKNLLIDWRLGEAYFASKLLDFDLSANNGGWQWAASSGCDAAPYFRVFNPLEQEKKFDPNREYIRRWVPEIDSYEYPDPIVDLKTSRERAINTYKLALKAE